MPEEIKSLFDLQKKFPTEQDCIDHLTKLRWDGLITSPFDPESKVYKCKNNRYRCKNTGKYFNVKTGTMFDNTKVPLQKWFMAIWLVTSNMKGISSAQLARDIDTTQKTAWFMLQRIRKCFEIENDNYLDGDVEVDEAYIGGENSNCHADKVMRIRKLKTVKDGQLRGKSAVVGMVFQRHGKANVHQVDDVKSSTLADKIINYVNSDARLFTDEYVGYNQVSMYNHAVVYHFQGEFANGDVTTNTIESFWAIVKRGVMRIYRFLSKKPSTILG